MQQNPAWCILAEQVSDKLLLRSKRVADVLKVRAIYEPGGGVYVMKRYCSVMTNSNVPHVAMRWCMAVGMTWALLACASNANLNDAADANGVPVWVSEGSVIRASKDGRRFQGVGSAPMLGDFSLQTSTADNRARSEINRILASYVEIVSRDFIASGDADESGFTEQLVAQQMDQLANIDLTGIQVIGHWTDKQSKVIYAIAEVDMQQVREAIKSAESLHPGLRKFISAEGNNIFDRIATTTE